MVEAVYLGSIDDDAAERVQIVVELLLDLPGPVDLLLDPYMAGGFKQHGFLLGLQRILRLLGVQGDHRSQRGVDGLRA